MINLEDQIQFVRLLAELNACGLTPEQEQFLKDSADIDPVLLQDIFDRAEEGYEALKTGLCNFKTTPQMNIQFVGHSTNFPRLREIQASPDYQSIASLLERGFIVFLECKQSSPQDDVTVSFAGCLISHLLNFNDNSKGGIYDLLRELKRSPGSWVCASKLDQTPLKVT